MQILLACSKNMSGEPAVTDCGCTEPEFGNTAGLLARQLASYSPDELQTLLNVNPKIASLNYSRYRNFTDETTKTPAIFAYDGKAFQCFAPQTMSCDDLMYANRHLIIGSFLYGMLRPLDRINRYRLEGNAELPAPQE